MKIRYIFAAAALLAICTHSKADDFSFARDKQIHFGGSILMGAAANVITDRPWVAFAGCSAVGAAVEVYQGTTGRGDPSYHDLAYDVAGCALGSYVGFKIKGLILAPRHDGLRVAYFKEF